MTIAIDLPWGPSLNSIWRKGNNRIYRNPKYIKWINEAGWLVKLGKHKRIDGQFSATIILNPPTKRRYDMDNQVKVLLDLAQKTNLIEDDYLCRLLIVSYGEADAAPLGTKLILNPMASTHIEIQHKM